MKYEKNTISDSIGKISDRHIEEAADYRAAKKNTAWLKWGSAAACFVLILSICILPMLDDTNPPENKDLLSLTVYAADGTENNMVYDQSFLSSGISGENIFGKDVPIFELYVAPVKEGEGSIFEKYDLEISYNGKLVEGKDEHIIVTFVIPVAGVEGVGRYCIIGWFEEETNIDVTLKDKESGETVENMTVNVKYSETDKAYQITKIYPYNIDGIDPDKLIYQGDESEVTQGEDKSEVESEVIRFPYIY